MSTAHDDVLKSALALPESERILLATELLDSIPGTPPGLSIDALDLKPNSNGDSMTVQGPFPGKMSASN